MAVRRALEDDAAQPGTGLLGRLALSKCEAADALGVSVDFLEEGDAPSSWAVQGSTRLSCWIAARVS